MSTEKSICIIGAGPAGLITAHTLIQDGFADVQIFTRDRSPGGTWCADRVYPNLYINNVSGEYKFSSHPMSFSDKARGGQLSGDDLRQYMESFVERCLKNKIHFNTEIVAVRRPENGDSGWLITTENLRNGTRECLPFDRIVLCTGGCSSSKFPAGLSPEDGKTAGFLGPIIHSTQFQMRLDDVIKAVKPISDTEPGTIVVVGGGKSAQDLSAYLTNQGRRVTLVFEKTDAFLAGKRPRPDCLRKSRFASLMSPSIELRTPLERFLHTTRIGTSIVRAYWNNLQSSSYDAFQIPKNSPLRLAPTPFWSIRVNDEGLGRPNNFFRLAASGKIQLLAPHRVESFGSDGRSIVLNDQKIIRADAIVLCTGYQSSWTTIFDRETKEDIGLERLLDGNAHEGEWDNYLSLANPPQSGDPPQWSPPLYRGLIPAKSILRRDIAVNGAVFGTELGYMLETAAHWIASYFREDTFLRLPATPEDAMADAKRNGAWMRKRFPESLHWVNESYSGYCVFFNWPQHCDQLLEDMGLKSMRSGGNWLTWPFKVVDTQEIAELGRERARKRGTD